MLQTKLYVPVIYLPANTYFFQKELPPRCCIGLAELIVVTYSTKILEGINPCPLST